MKLFKNWNLKKHLFYSLIASVLFGIAIYITMRVEGTYLQALGGSSSNGGFSISYTSGTYSIWISCLSFIVMIILYAPINYVVNKK